MPSAKYEGYTITPSKVMGNTMFEKIMSWPFFMTSYKRDWELVMSPNLAHFFGSMPWPNMKDIQQCLQKL